MIKFLFCLTAVFFVPLSAKADDSLLCLKETARQEKEEGIQTNLLSAIALVESGRFSKEYPSGIAWPWTVTAAGKGYYFASRREAVSAVRSLQEKGVENIDVGCMQINLKYHPDAFKTVEDAFDPRKNVAYAADFLKRNHADTRSWGEAATRYHSKTNNKALRYEDKLLDAWKRLSRYGNPAAPSVHAKPKNVAEKTVRDVKKQIREQQKNSPNLPAKEKKVKAGSPESKALADKWRKEKLEKYIRQKHRTPSDNHIPASYNPAGNAEEKSSSRSPVPRHESFDPENSAETTPAPPSFSAGDVAGTK